MWEMHGVLGRHVVRLVFLELEEVEIISAGLDGGGPLEGARADGKKGEPGGSASAFWLPVSSTSIPSSSIGVGTTENEERYRPPAARPGIYSRPRRVPSAGSSHRSMSRYG